MKKKGFTLIELLAVIVILAIIALIATPLVLKYIETARKDTFKNTIESIERVAELKVIDMETKSKVIYPYELDVKDLDLKNKDKLNGTVLIEKSNNKYIYTYDITDNEYKIYGHKDSEVYKLDKTVKLKLKTANGVIDDTNNIVYSFYDEGDEYRRGYCDIMLSDYFESENGTLEFQKNSINCNSTGSKIIVKDKEGKVAKTYTVVIFGELNGDGWIGASDDSMIGVHIRGFYNDLDNFKMIAADINNDGSVNEDDGDMILNYDAGFCYCSQINRGCNCSEGI